MDSKKLKSLQEHLASNPGISLVHFNEQGEWLFNKHKDFPNTVAREDVLNLQLRSEEPSGPGALKDDKDAVITEQAEKIADLEEKVNDFDFAIKAKDALLQTANEKIEALQAIIAAKPLEVVTKVEAKDDEVMGGETATKKKK